MKLIIESKSNILYIFPLVIIKWIDFSRDGQVSLQEYMAFMISRETENVQSSSEVMEAFRALTSGDKPFITAQELYAVSIIHFIHPYMPYASTNKNDRHDIT